MHYSWFYNYLLSRIQSRQGTKYKKIQALKCDRRVSQAVWGQACAEILLLYLRVPTTKCE